MTVASEEADEISVIVNIMPELLQDNDWSIDVSAPVPKA